MKKGKNPLEIPDICDQIARTSFLGPAAGFILVSKFGYTPLGLLNA